MFMSGPDNINKLPIDSSRMTGAGAVKKVSGHGGPSAVGGVNPKVSEGATVAGTGKDGNTAGQALLGMMSNPNGIVPVSGFSNGKTEKKLEDGATIETHAAALLTDGPEANGKFQQLMNLASRGVPLKQASLHEIGLGRQAVMPLEGKDGQLAAALRLAFNSADRQGPITTGAIINSFHEAQE